MNTPDPRLLLLCESKTLFTPRLINCPQQSGNVSAVFYTTKLLTEDDVLQSRRDAPGLGPVTFGLN
ncbi:hypothetical protein EYF80_013070 [Liparis tanakae]|uniref:Uncharacterized protein n=1 Tax=Liparis tanakae TaxID=230148 RepID=A0A4Z2IF68_9TELE|nr:hypothetical protein EYF80_013070 [Liparis tanakae]